MSTKANSKIDTEDLRDIIREEVKRQLHVSRFRQLQRRLASYRDEADYESEEEMLEDIS